MPLLFHSQVNIYRRTLKAKKKEEQFIELSIKKISKSNAKKHFHYVARFCMQIAENKLLIKAF